MYKVVINLKNKNALVALAYIKTNENPVVVFCNYILYVLSKSSTQSMRIDELHDSVYEEFGLDLPIQMINICTKILKKRKSVEILPNGAGLHFCDESFDITSFDDAFAQLHFKETSVINCLTGYVKKRWKIEWSYDDAKRYLSVFLDEQGNAASIFLDDEMSKANKLSPSWYIGHFVTDLQNQRESVEWKYLLDIVNGMMIYQGVYYIDDYNQNKAQKFKDTEFYIDTKLLLRYLGYSFPEQVKAARELIDLIINEYQGRIMVFDQTIAEVSNALAAAGREYNRKKEINDWELRGYVALNPTGAELLSEKAEALMTTIEKSNKISRCEVSDWGRPEYHKHYINDTALTSFIKSEHESWRDGTIKNDVAVINQINILRKSDYSIRYGGKSKLPVFVTTNLSLVYSVKNYIINAKDNEGELYWNSHALPVISDNMLLFRLWVPVANKYSELPAITMSKYAYAAQNVGVNYFAVLKEKAEQYRQEKSLDTINISEARRSKLEEIIIKNTNGDSDQLTDEIYAISVDEFLALEKIDMQDSLDKKDAMLSKKDNIIEEQNQEIVALLARPYINKLGLKRFLIWLAEFWWLESAIVLYLLAYAFNCFANVGTDIINWRSVVLFAIPLIIEIVGKVIDYYASNPILLDWLVKPVIRYVSQKYAYKILKSTTNKDEGVQKAVLERCFSNTRILMKYKSYIPSIDILLELLNR